MWRYYEHHAFFLFFSVVLLHRRLLVFFSLHNARSSTRARKNLLFLYGRLMHTRVVFARARLLPCAQAADWMHKRERACTSGVRRRRRRIARIAFEYYYTIDIVFLLLHTIVL